MKKNNQIEDIHAHYPECLIIECHEMTSWVRYIIEGFITFFLWCSWVSLWIPLVEVLTKTYFGFNVDQKFPFGFMANSESISEASLSGFFDNLYFFLHGVITVVILTTLWVLYNLIIYKSRHKISCIRLKLCIVIRRILTPLKSLCVIMENIYMCIEKILEIHHARKVVCGCHLPQTDMERLAEKIGVCKEKLLEVQHSKRIVYFFSQDDSVSKIDLSSMCTVV